MFFFPKLLLHSFAFLVLMESFLLWRDAFDYRFFGILFLVFFEVWLAGRQLCHGNRFSFFVSAIFAFSALALLYFIDSIVHGHIFAFLSVGIFYFLHLGSLRLSLNQQDMRAQGFVAASMMATLFVVFATIGSFYTRFVVPVWLVGSIFFLAVSLVSQQYFFLISPQNKKRTHIYGLLLALFAVELFLISCFWPFGYLTTAGVILVFYYVFWNTLRLYLLGELTKRQIIGDVLFFFFVCILLLVTTFWSYVG